MRDGGKGDTPRPLGVPLEKFDNNWDAIFGNKKKLDSSEYDFDEKTNTFTPKEKKQLEDAMDKRAKELMKEVKELIGKK
jgi:hypothetical protein